MIPENNPDRIIDAQRRDGDDDTSIRPLSIEEFIGQAKLRVNLKIFIETAE